METEEIDFESPPPLILINFTRKNILNELSCLHFIYYFFSYVATNASVEPLTEDFVTQFTVVVLTNSSLEEQLRIAEITRKHNIALIIASTPGLFAQVFTDFGAKFRVFDTNGEQPLSCMMYVLFITKIFI